MIGPCIEDLLSTRLRTAREHGHNLSRRSLSLPQPGRPLVDNIPPNVSVDDVAISISQPAQHRQWDDQARADTAGGVRGNQAHW
jgi:hypothetical protein